MVGKVGGEEGEKIGGASGKQLDVYAIYSYAS